MAPVTLTGMQSSRTIVAIIAALAGSLPVVPSSYASSAPLLTCDGLPCVDAVADNAKHLRLAIDTGDPGSVLNRATASALGLQIDPYRGKDGKPVSGMGVTSLRNLHVGGSALGDVRVLVMDLSDDIRKGVFPKVDGTLAYGVFKDRELVLDFSRQAIDISPAQAASSPCPENCGKISLITFGHHGPPIITSTGFSVNGMPVTSQIDTMYSGTLLVYPESVPKLDLSKESQSRRTQYFPFTDAGVDMYEATARAESFGTLVLGRGAPLYFAGPKVHLPDGLFDATVGMGLLNGHRVSFDFHGMYFSLQ